MMNAFLLSLCMVLLGLVTFTLAAPIGQSQPIRHRGRRPETKEEIKTYLDRFGHYRSRSGNKTNRTDDDLKSALRSFQKYFKLNVTGEANNETMELMGSPRCGVSDNISKTARRRRFATFGSKWPTLRLTYLFRNYTPDLPVDGTRSAIQLALKDWSDVAPLTFVESLTTSANIKFLFASLDHGDGNSFDGTGGVLAHAYSPTNGNTHFDEDENWTNSASGTNLRQVATHELGHALGLDHSDDKNAVMYPYYRYKAKFALDIDDIKGIQSLYGARPMTPDATSSTRSSSSSSSTLRSSEKAITSKSSSAASTAPSTTRQPTSSTSRSSAITSKSSSSASTTRFPTTSTNRQSTSSSSSTSSANSSKSSSTASTTRFPTSSNRQPTSRNSAIASKSSSVTSNTRFPTSTTTRQAKSSSATIPQMAKPTGCSWFMSLFGRC